MIVAALLERAHPGNSTAIIKAAIQQQTLLGVVDYCRPALHQFRGERYLCNRDNSAAPQADGAFVEHARIDMHSHLPALLDDRINRGRQCGHVVPMPMGHCNALDLTQPYPQIDAVAYEDGTFR